MARPRKRKRLSESEEDQKRLGIENESKESTYSGPEINHPVLSCFYHNILTLRQYLLSRLPETSKRRRRAITLFGFEDVDIQSCPRSADIPRKDILRLLDTTIVGFDNGIVPCRDDDYEHDLAVFSQQVPGSSLGSTLAPGDTLQSEIVDFVIWHFFKHNAKPSHILCRGFLRASGPSRNGLNLRAALGIPGVVSYFPNTHVETVKSPIWSTVLASLGRGGDRVMLDLLIHCTLFVSLEDRSGNYSQLSGVPLSGLKPIPQHLNSTCIQGTTRKLVLERGEASSPTSSIRDLVDIKFVRTRMFYGKPATNANGNVKFGLRHIHVLNRYRDVNDVNQTVHVMKYIFPRQFGLHNVFTSTVDFKESAHIFKDYTLREQEIAVLQQRRDIKRAEKEKTDMCQQKIPKRLRGMTVELVTKLRKLHQRCSYAAILQYYCPISALDKSRLASHALPKEVGNSTGNVATQYVNVEEPKYTELACSVSEVSAFCRAVLLNIVPHGFWGDTETYRQNEAIISKYIDMFIRARKSESLSIHEIIQNFKITDLSWLRCPRTDPNGKMSQTDFSKRKEVFLEFIYYVFDSLLIPLVRFHFYVTESNVHKNRLFYFRHDVWKKLTEPSLTTLKFSMFEELETERAVKLFARRPIGFSKVRLLPKEKGMRPITNLRRRTQVQQKGKIVLGRSINSFMTPAFKVFKFEKTSQPSRLGSSIFSMADLYPKLKSFRNSLKHRGLDNEPLFFAKVDVRSCFDTIPQKQLLELMENICSVNEYRVDRHVEITAPNYKPYDRKDRFSSEPRAKFLTYGRPAGIGGDFNQRISTEHSFGKTNTVFVDGVVGQLASKKEILDMLREHVQRNIVKMGKKFYRQKQGIPQGSILSSLLCNLFYGELERKHLAFLSGPGSLLLRLVDDFLLITTERTHAEEFLRVMHRGLPDYGVSIKPEKSLANFDIVLGKTRITKPVDTNKFPYCGISIGVPNLEISKIVNQKERDEVMDGLTVERSRAPGLTFRRKTLNAFKIRMHGMFLDTTFNSVATVLQNLHQSFHESAVRCLAYLKCLPKLGRSVSRILIKTVEDVIALATILMRQSGRIRRIQQPQLGGMVGYRYTVSRKNTTWLACKAFQSEFQRRQTQFSEFLRWLDEKMSTNRPTHAAELAILEQILKR